MINFSAISNKSITGKILRLFLRLIPKNAVVRILQGPLKHKKWIKGSGVNSYWLGSYELSGQKVFMENLKKGDIVFDIGANVGFYSLLAADIVGSEGKVFAFEPLEENFSCLKKHIEINNYKNIFALKVAVSDQSGAAFLKKEKNASMAHLSDEGINIETISLDDWIQNKKLPIPDFLKIDVEGAELKVLKGAKNFLFQRRPIIFLSVHNKDLNKNCREFLKSLGYHFNVMKEDNLGGASEILAKPR